MRAILLSGRRASLTDWLCTAAIAAVFSVLLYQGLMRTWRESGIPAPVQSYLKWEKSHTPAWFVHLF